MFVEKDGGGGHQPGRGRMFFNRHYSFEYTGINKHQGKDVGLSDKVLSKEDYEVSFVNEP
jgi:hypothetical protein